MTKIAFRNSSNSKINTLYSEIKGIIEQGKKSIVYAANFAMVQTYWHIGKLIVENEQHGKQRAEYGKALIAELAEKLSAEYGKGFNSSNLWYMRQFYNTYEKLHALRGELSWTHYRLLLKVERADARAFYMQQAIESNWSTRTLERQIYSLYFERILKSSGKKRKLISKEAKLKAVAIQPKDIIKDPYVLDFLDLNPNITLYEQELEQAIINKLQAFLLELGKGFSFVGRQHRISLEGDHFYIDLVFYNYILKCFLLVDLKIGKLTHQDVGQMDMYVRIFEEKMRQTNDNPTIGLILCTAKNNAVVKYSLLNENKNIFASKYKTILPSIKQLKNEIESNRELIEMEKRLRFKNK